LSPKCESLNAPQKRKHTHMLLGMAWHSYLMVRNTQNSGWHVASRQHKWMTWNGMNRVEIEWIILGCGSKMVLVESSTTTLEKQWEQVMQKVRCTYIKANVVFLLFSIPINSYGMPPCSLATTTLEICWLCTLSCK